MHRHVIAAAGVQFQFDVAGIAPWFGFHLDYDASQFFLQGCELIRLRPQAMLKQIYRSQAGDANLGRRDGNLGCRGAGLAAGHWPTKKRPSCERVRMKGVEAGGTKALLSRS